MNSIRNLLSVSLLSVCTIAYAAAGAPAGDATATPEFAPGSHGGPWHHHRAPGRLYSKLGLSPEQQTSMKAIWTASKPQIQSLHETMRANHLKLAQTPPDDPNYGNVVAEVAQSNAALASKRTSEMAEMRAQMYAVLTPPQKTQLATLQAQMAANPHRGPQAPIVQ